MLVMRFARVGRKNKPQFRIVVQEHTTAPTGRNVEVVGSWDPSQKKGVFENERIQYWLSQGATASDTVHNLLISHEIIKGEKIKVKMPKKEIPAEEVAAQVPATEGEVKTKEAVAPKEEALVAEEVKEEAPKEAEGENK